MQKVRLITVHIILLLAVQFIATPVWAAGGTGSFARTFGSFARTFEATSIQQTADGGFIVAGFNSSVGSSQQTWLLRLDRTGAIIWQMAYCSPGFVPFLVPTGPKAKPTPDGGFIVVTSKEVSPSTMAAGCSR